MHPLGLPLQSIPPSHIPPPRNIPAFPHPLVPPPPPVPYTSTLSENLNPNVPEFIPVVLSNTMVNGTTEGDGKLDECCEALDDSEDDAEKRKSEHEVVQTSKSMPTDLEQVNKKSSEMVSNLQNNKHVENSNTEHSNNKGSKNEDSEGIKPEKQEGKFCILT